MSTITIIYHLSDAGQRAALLAGLPGQRENRLTVAQGDAVYPRALAMADIAEDGSGTVDLRREISGEGPMSRGMFRGRGASARHYDALQTAAALVDDEEVRYAAQIAKEAAEADAKAAAKAEAEAAALAADRAALREHGEALRNYQGEHPGTGVVIHIMDGNRVSRLSEFPDPRVFGGEYAQIYAAASASAVERFRVREKREEDGRRAALRAWAMERGSERLRALIEEHFAWVPVAEDEFFEANTPEGYAAAKDMPGDDWERKESTKPGMEAIKALRGLRALCEVSNGVLSDPGLEFVIAKYDEDEDGGRREPEKFQMLSVAINAPNGKTREVFRKA